MPVSYYTVRQYSPLCYQWQCCHKT